MTYLPVDSSSFSSPPSSPQIKNIKIMPLRAMTVFRQAPMSNLDPSFQAIWKLLKETMLLIFDILRPDKPQQRLLVVALFSPQSSNLLLMCDFWCPHCRFVSSQYDDEHQTIFIRKSYLVPLKKVCWHILPESGWFHMIFFGGQIVSLRSPKWWFSKGLPPSLSPKKRH